MQLDRLSGWGMDVGDEEQTRGQLVGGAVLRGEKIARIYRPCVIGGRDDARIQNAQRGDWIVREKRDVTAFEGFVWGEPALRPTTARGHFESLNSICVHCSLAPGEVRASNCSSHPCWQLMRGVGCA